MTTRIEITTTVSDSRAIVRQKKLRALGFTNVHIASIADIYTIDKKFSQIDLQKIGEALTNPVMQKFIIRHFEPTEKPHPKNKQRVIDKKRSFVNTQDDNKFSYAIEIGFLPGAREAASAGTAGAPPPVPGFPGQDSPGGGIS